jgi:hypothetical protein
MPFPKGLEFANAFSLFHFRLALPYRKYRVISRAIHFPTGTETPFPIIR